MFNIKHPMYRQLHIINIMSVLFSFINSKKMYTNTLRSSFGNSPLASSEMVDHKIRPENNQFKYN